MHDLAVHREDAGEADDAALGRGYAADAAGYLLFGNARAAHAHGRGVHLIAYGAGTLDLGNLFGRLHDALGDHGLDELLAGSSTLVARMDAGEVHELDHDVVAIGRQEMNLASAVAGIHD